MESDSEGSLRDFIDDDDDTEEDDDDTETTKSSNGLSSDESHVQVMAEGAGTKSKSATRITRNSHSKGKVEGEWTLYTLTTSFPLCIEKSFVCVQFQCLSW
jgi:hypothetical protein